ncbi:MAG: hypothetical protein JJE21_00915 [Spirochaetaceae bacterium]|nr:hypothetical protein [Spirochaetaceae bacterium]
MKKNFVLLTLLFAIFVSVIFSGGKSEKKASEYKIKDTVKLCISSEPDSLNPWISAASDTSAIMDNVFEGLMGFNEEGTLVPRISSSYTVSTDGLVYTFKIRDDVYFHNGKHLSSADVLYSYQSFLKDGGNGNYRFPSISSIAAPDDYTFVVTLSSPSASFLISTVEEILPKGYDKQATLPIGTGPYKFVEYQPSQKIVFEANENYYDKTRLPSIKNVIVYIMSDSSSIIAALQSNQLDAAEISSNNADLLSDNYNVITGPRNLVSVLVLNNKIAPLDNVKVRTAINMAIKKEDVVNGVFDGYAQVINSNISPVYKKDYNNDLLTINSYDLTKAKDLLSQAGYPNGFDLEITIPSNYWQHVDTAQIIQQQLLKIGINVKLKNVEWGTWLDQVYTNRNYSSTIIGIDGKLDPYDALVRYTTDSRNNFFNYSNSEYDAVLNSTLSASGQELSTLYKKAQEIMAKDAGSAFICAPSSIVATTKDLKGYMFYPVYFINFDSLYYENSSTN